MSAERSNFGSMFSDGGEKCRPASCVCVCCRDIVDMESPNRSKEVELNLKYRIVFVKVSDIAGCAGHY